MEACRKYPAANEWVHFLLEQDRNKKDACWVQEGISRVPEGNLETRKWPSFYPSNGWKFLKAFGTRLTSEWVLLLNCERKDRQSWLQNLALCVSHECCSLKALSTPITQLCVDDHKRQYPLPPPWPTFCQLAGVLSCIMCAPILLRPAQLQETLPAETCWTHSTLWTVPFTVLSLIGTDPGGPFNLSLLEYPLNFPASAAEPPSPPLSPCSTFPCTFPAVKAEPLTPQYYTPIEKKSQKPEFHISPI